MIAKLAVTAMVMIALEARTAPSDAGSNRQVVAKVLEVDLALQKINPPNLVVTATGEVPTAGFSDVRLSHNVQRKPPADGILDIELTAAPPGGAVAQVVSTVQASITIKDFQTALPWLRGVRIHGRGNGVRIAMLQREKPVEAAERRKVARKRHFSVASKAINALGIDLLKQPDLATGNVLLSPYSIQTALAMTYAGADGETKTEMAKTLHYPADEEQVHGSFAGLQSAMEEVARATKHQAEKAKADGRVTDPVTLTTANRLYGERSYQFLKPFLRQLNDVYRAPLEPMDFRGSPELAREAINQWVENQTQKRISGVVPEGGVDALTRLVLVNAIY